MPSKNPKMSIRFPKWFHDDFTAGGEKKNLINHNELIRIIGKKWLYGDRLVDRFIKPEYDYAEKYDFIIEELLERYQKQIEELIKEFKNRNHLSMGEIVKEGVLAANVYRKQMISGEDKETDVDKEKVIKGLLLLQGLFQLQNGNSQLTTSDDYLDYFIAKSAKKMMVNERDEYILEEINSKEFPEVELYGEYVTDPDGITLIDIYEVNVPGESNLDFSPILNDLFESIDDVYTTLVNVCGLSVKSIKFNDETYERY
jgi:hypothetical protein